MDPILIARLNADFDFYLQYLKTVSPSNTDIIATLAKDLLVMMSNVKYLRAFSQQFPTFDFNTIVAYPNVTVVEWAIISDDIEILRFLLERNAIIPKWAIGMCYTLEQLQLLLQYGASLKYTNDNGNLLHIYVRRKDAPIVKWLLLQRVPIIPNIDGIYPHQIGCEEIFSQKIEEWEYAPLNPYCFMGNEDQRQLLLTFILIVNKNWYIPPELIYHIMFYM